MLRWTALCVAAGTACADGTDLLLKACNTSDPSQRFARTSVPSNLPSSDIPLNAAQVVLTAAPGCPTSGDSRCCMNVEAWGTKAGDRVWTTVCAAVEPVEHELNRIWVHDNTTGSLGDVLLNPASKMCADAPNGVNAEPGDRLQLVDCNGSNASKWVFSPVDGSLSQASHSGAYPGLCLASYVAPTPVPAPAPSPQTFSALLSVPTSGAAVASTSQEMVSFNLDWHENGEETPLWINMSALVLDLKNPKLVAAAKALSPAVLRIGGSEGDVLCYDVPQFNSTCADMNQTDPAMCLPMSRLEELCEFASNTGLSMAFGLNAVWGRKDHDLNNPLDFTNIEALLAYVASSEKLDVFGFELGNEKCGPPPAILAGDYWKLKGLLAKYWPDAKTRPRLIGNDCNTNPAYLSEFLPLLNNSVLDVLTYHRYIGNGIDPDLVHKMMQPSFLDQVVSSDLQAVHTKYAPSAELWVGEGAAAWHSGQDGATNAFASSFWWSNALGALSANNHTHYCRQTLIGGSYGLLNRTNFEPNPDFYVGSLFHSLMGNAVLDATANASSAALSLFAEAADPVADGWLRVYAHCSANRDSPRGAVTVLLLNLSPSFTFDLAPAEGTSALHPRSEYVFTAESVSSRYVSLNDQLLVVDQDGHLPKMPGRASSQPHFSLPPLSIAFLELPSFAAKACL